MSSMASISFKNKNLKGQKKRNKNKKKETNQKQIERKKKGKNCWYCHKSLEFTWRDETKLCKFKQIIYLF